MIKHTIIFHRTKWQKLISCICPQILGILSLPKQRKYSKMPGVDTHKLVWNYKPKGKKL